VTPPSAHTIRQALIEIVGAYERLYPPESHSIPHFVASAGKSECDSAGLQLLDEAE
jgi:hypothetical protein